MVKLSGLRVAALVADGFEQQELAVPRQRLEQEGAHVDVVAPGSGDVRAWNRTAWGLLVGVDVSLSECHAAVYDALLIPGGVIGVDALRASEEAVDFVASFLRHKKPVAAACHGPWLLAEAGVLRGRRVTSYKTIRTDLVNAGAYWTDEDVVMDRQLVTTRSPSDLPAFIRKTVQVFAESFRPRASGVVHEGMALPN